MKKKTKPVVTIAKIELDHIKKVSQYRYEYALEAHEDRIDWRRRYAILEAEKDFYKEYSEALVKQVDELQTKTRDFCSEIRRLKAKL